MPVKRRYTYALLPAVLLTLAGALPLIASGADGPSSKAQSAAQGVKGKFSLLMMVHTSHGGFGDLPGVKPWNGSLRSKAKHIYRSIPCSDEAPINNIASDLPSYEGRVRRSRVPSSMRAHPFAFRLRKSKKKGMRMVGTLRLTVCKLDGGSTFQFDPVSDARKPKITVRFDMAPKRMTGEVVHFEGKFRLRGGTQRYRGLSGSGNIAGYLFCFARVGCARGGRLYRDGQFVMQGSYADRTPQLSTPQP